MFNPPKKFMSLHELKEYMLTESKRKPNRLHLSYATILSGLGATEKEWSGTIFLFENSIALHAFLSKRDLTTMQSKLFFDILSKDRGMMKVDNLQLGKLSSFQWLYFQQAGDA